MALYEPEIPPNTGNIIRLSANTGIGLHLIHPLGFNPDDRQLKRAGLDYHEWAKVHHYKHYEHFLEVFCPKRMFACSTRGHTIYTAYSYEPEDVFLFGPETRGLPATLLQTFSNQHIIRIPMLKTTRSLNLSNSVAIIVYEALRQIGFNVVSLR